MATKRAKKKRVSILVSNAEDEEVRDRLPPISQNQRVVQTTKESSRRGSECLDNTKKGDGAHLLQKRRTRKLTPADLERKRKARERFRRLIRVIKTNLLWAKDLDDKATDDEVSQAFVVKNRGDDDQLSFDPSQFKVKDIMYGGITASIRKILIKPNALRTDDERLAVQGVVGRLKCFEKYSPTVKKDISKVIFYERFDANRIVLKQGHLSFSAYFVVSGVLEATYLDEDSETKQPMLLGLLTEGASFGELALLHNIRRTATVKTSSLCELLRLDQEDFTAVLQKSYEREWNARLSALRWLPPFKGWKDSELELCNNFCILQDYPDGSILHGGTANPAEEIFFILSGQCWLVRELPLIKEIITLKSHIYHMPSLKAGAMFVRQMQNDRRLDMRRDTACPYVKEKHLWTIGTLVRGLYFGVGEKMENTYVIAKGAVEVLKVPMVQFKLPERMKAVIRMRDDLNAFLPENEELFKRYFEQRRWEEYKKDICNEIVGRRKRKTTTKIADIPQTIMSDINNVHLGRFCTNIHCCGRVLPYLKFYKK